MSTSKNLQKIATEIEDPLTGKPKIFCEFCCVTFSSIKNLYRHLRRFHDLPVALNANHICGVCNQKIRTIPLLQEHLQNEHSIALKFVDKTFYSQEEFLDWKSKVERESLSYFNSRQSSKTDDGTSRCYYHCHRSGQSKRKQNCIRNMKAFRSIKAGSTCPAIMKVSTVTIDGISEIKVNYQSVHVGHDLEIRTIRLKKEERANLASCLKLGMSKDKILEQARQNPSPTNRYSALTRQHLHNICKDFGIKINVPKPKKRNGPPAVQTEASDSSNNCADYLEVDTSNSGEVQESEQTHENVRIQGNEIRNDERIQGNEIRNDERIQGNVIGNNERLQGNEIGNNERIESNEKMQEFEKNTAVSSLLLLQNQNYSDGFNSKKGQIVNQLKEVLLRVEEWDSACPLPEVEEHIRALKAVLDISASSSWPKLHLDETLPDYPVVPNENPAKKQKKIINSPKKRASTHLGKMGNLEKSGKFIGQERPFIVQGNFHFSGKNMEIVPDNNPRC